MAALKQQFEQLKEAGAAKKAELTKARKAAIAKAVEERTKIVEKAEALASSLDDEINWRSTADKFRSLFDQWQQDHRRGEPAEGLDRMGRDLAPVQRVDGPLEAGRPRRPQR